MRCEVWVAACVVRGGACAGGSSFGSTLLVVLLTVGLTVGGLYAVYHYVLKQRMEGEIRDIMSQVRAGACLRQGSGLPGAPTQERNGIIQAQPESSFARVPGMRGLAR